MHIPLIDLGVKEILTLHKRHSFIVHSNRMKVEPSKYLKYTDSRKRVMHTLENRAESRIK